MNGRRIRELLSSHPALTTARELDRLLGELFHAAACEWKDAQKGRELQQLETVLDLAHSDLARVFRGEKKLGGRLFRAPPELLAIFLRELRVYQLLASGTRVDADVRGGNADLVIALADMQAHDSRSSADDELSPDECRRGLELCDAAQAELDRRRRLYERGLGERGVRTTRGSA